MTDVEDAVLKAATDGFLPDQSACRILQNNRAVSISLSQGVSLLDVERTSLENDIVPERYIRNFATFTTAEQLTLLNSHVAIFGLGGLGGCVTEILARMGLGGLTLVDGDCFDISNLNRQLLATENVIGHPKSLVAQQRVTQINPAIQVVAIPEFLSEPCNQHVLLNADVAVDCLDNLPTRFLLETISGKCGIPMVTAAVAGLSGQLMTILPDKPRLETIYGPATSAPMHGVETRLGCLAPAVFFLASLECNEIINLLLHRSSNLTKGLLVFDMNDYAFEVIDTMD